MEKGMRLYMLVCVAMVAILSMQTMGTMEDDDKDCADQLTTLAACIPYVSGTAKAPTKQCCEDTQKVKDAKPKCLCVLIKESTDPSMGLPINTTLALKMPSACNIDAKPSECPTLLKLAPDSPDAKIFKDPNAKADSTSTATSPSTSTTPSSDSASTGSSTTTSGSGSSTSKTTTASTNNGSKLKLFNNGIVFGLMFLSCMVYIGMN
ncbi:hypothetical protein MKW94_019535 [Papaver nudicaule]|uniref:Bifunctional inhibitor/plant lipid transfer protein/seed storage helical domain-containing protein n=1 Tax=Papaver nudicaule TaxID=74823 RepID=A0AA42B244_PAPNU|nr:hypothetical protein [Papaver nudicaule]